MTPNHKEAAESLRAMIDLHLSWAEREDRPTWANLESAAKAEAYNNALNAFTGKRYRQGDIERLGKRAFERHLQDSAKHLYTAVSATLILREKN